MCFQRSSERIEGKSRPPQSGWKIVPQSRTGCRETPIAKERSNGLMLNPRPYLVCNNSASASTVNRCDIPIVVVPITSARSVLDLGIYTLMRAHVNQTVSWCFAALRRLRQIRRAVPTATFQILVVALVIVWYTRDLIMVMQYWWASQPTWCADCSRCSTRPHLRLHDHITDALTTLHWLRVPERVQYKIAVLTYKVQHDSAPRYLRPLVTVADQPGRRALRSASTSRLVIPPIKLSTVGSRAFPVAAAQVWNCLPEAVISSSSLQSFRRQ